MGFLQWLGVKPEPAPERPATRMGRTRPSAQFGVDIPPEMTEAMTAGGVLAPRISRNEALQVPAVLRGRNLICSTLAGLPLKIHGPDRREVDGYLLGGNIDPDVPNVVTLANTLEDLLFEGIAWWRVTRWGWHNYPVEAHWVPESSVHVHGTRGLPSQSQVSPDLLEPRDGQVFIDGVPVRDEEVIRFDSPNPPLLRHAARAIRTCLRLDRTAAMYADSPMPLGTFEQVEGADPPDDDELAEILESWETARKERAWAYIEGLKANPLQWDAEKIQLADQRQHAVLEIARAMGIDPEDLGVSTTSRTYQNAETRRLDLLDFTLAAYVTAVQQRLSMRDVLPRGYVARMKFDGFLRSDTRTRMETYRTGLQVGAYTHEEIRELEDRPALTPEETPEIPTTRSPGQLEADVPAEQFDTDTEARVSFDSPEVASTFRVNTEKRTISGLIVPWGKTANNGQAKWRFEEGSLYWVDEGRTKLNLYHDHTQAMARAVRLQNVSAGLDATFQVARGAEGDRALSLAEDGVLDGFSIEIDFEDGDGWEPDPSDRSVRLVKRAKLRGVALTAMPAFDDARVSAVAASLDKRKDTTMATETVTTDGQQAADFDLDGYLNKLVETTTESHKKLTEELGASIGESISAGFKTALENLPSPQDGPQTVRASRFTVTREAPVYSFNGLGHSLVKDAWYAGREQDADAIDRLRKYRKQQDEMAKLAAQFTAGQSFAPQSTSTASEVIPPGYRPDLYVPELMQGRPLVGLCSRGTIGNATPFLVPVFEASEDATGDHTEGTNPSDGSLSFDEETVTPGAISGRLTLTREIVDSSNPAIDQIALATMRESYNRQTEQKVYAALNGSATTTVEYDGDTVIIDVRDLLAQYPFVRFAAPTGGAINQKVTRAFATAVGTDGRPLLPSVGAQNTAGMGNAVNQGWDVDGLVFRPAWSITDDAEDDVALIVNRADAWVWESPLLTFRFEEKQGPANIELNVFGYFATHVLRPAGIFAVRNPENGS